MSSKEDMQETEASKIQLAVIANDVDYIKKSIDDIRRNYVTRQEFLPVKSLVFGLAGLVLTSVAGAIIATVIR